MLLFLNEFQHDEAKYINLDIRLTYLRISNKDSSTPSLRNIDPLRLHIYASGKGRYAFASFNSGSLRFFPRLHESKYEL